MMPVTPVATVLTPPGMSALAVVRLTGAGDFVRSRFDGNVGGVRYGNWNVDGSALDDVLLVGEPGDCEVHLHGGVWLVKRFLDDAAANEIKVITSGAALRAGRAIAAERGKIDTFELAEQLLPLAKTEAGITAILSQPRAWRTGAADPNDPTLRYLLDGVTIALVGAPNAGKSTLANRLSSETRSLVSDRAGTTRDWLEHHGQLDGLPIRWIDTPGRRETDDAIEREAIALSEAIVARADLVIHLQDATAPIADDARADLVVWNKCDLGPHDGVAISAETGAGFDRFGRAVHEALGVDLGDLNRPMML